MENFSRMWKGGLVQNRDCVEQYEGQSSGVYIWPGSSGLWW